MGMPKPGIIWKAMALGWNDSGGWSVRTAPVFTSASSDAVTTCSTQFGDCRLSDVVVMPDRFGCMAVARANDDASRLFATIGGSLDAARAAVFQQMSDAALAGKIEYAGCNG
jgi:hypothetical protein